MAAARGHILNTGRRRNRARTLRQLLSSSVSREKAQERPDSAESCESGPLTSRFGSESDLGGQKSQSSSSVASALPMTYDEPEPEKKSWFSSAFGESAERIAGFTSVTVAGNIAS
ncbi:hypothetical protein RS81_02111 [Microbacterium terrae]|uniref:Uncharacterized protein n=1 Tax=Microbacterium terrae TaxID=69369 RepID=A0A0M2GZG3_9MICO|nr:hypothetical protein RS81_02111 [Microbacterium terrae]